MRYFIFVFFFLISVPVFAQEPADSAVTTFPVATDDSVSVSDTVPPSEAVIIEDTLRLTEPVQPPVVIDKPVHSVRKATLLSTFLPGAGQIYNRKAWKVPIIYGGFVGLGLAIKFNHDYYKDFNNALLSRYDSDTTNVDEYAGKYSDDDLRNLSSDYRRNRDFMIVISTLVYVLNIIDAHVDAHLFSFDVDDNLGMQVQPTLHTSPFIGKAPQPGISLKLTFR